MSVLFPISIMVAASAVTAFLVSVLLNEILYADQRYWYAWHGLPIPARGWKYDRERRAAKEADARR